MLLFIININRQMKRIAYLSFALALLIVTSACKKDGPSPVTNQFEIRIENVLSPKSYLASGSTGLIMPGQSESISFQAGIGSYLSFATMFVQSNDLFYGFSDQGLGLYDEEGNPVTGDVTSFVDLWDAGTEINEEPGTGANQPPRQAAGNTGSDENGIVQLISAVGDGFSYPSDEEVIRLTLTHDGGTEFTLQIENISGSSSLATPLAPGAWGIHGNGVKLFEDGATAPEGLEGVAEDGDNALLVENLVNETAYVSPLAPGAWALTQAGSFPLFEDSQSDLGKGLEALSEDGDPAELAESFGNEEAVSMSGVFNTPEGASDAGLLFPGGSYVFTVEAGEGDYLHLATMLVHTNDLFYGFDQEGIALYQNGSPVSGDLTSQLSLWDAGTEVNEYPGAGNNQPARGGPNSGQDENGVVRIVDDGFSYPTVSEAIRISIQPL
ncbi:MAG: spondin domain-containing protein [Bacteroidota bacterium]